jgi:thymidylate synthase (FAD)
MIKIHNSGFVDLVDHMGDDERIVTSARISTNRGAKTPQEDAQLIDYLMRNRHTSPFEQVLFTFHLKMPIFVARQWVRHRTARMNEISGRYVEFEAEFFLPEELRIQSANNHQASEPGDIATEKEILDHMDLEQDRAKRGYERYLEEGVAREMARINLPLSTYTEFYWNIDLHNLFHFLRLRTHHHAQKEIRDYAEAIATLIQPIVPMAYEAWERHERYGVKLSREEVVFIGDLLKKHWEVLAPQLSKRDARILAEKFGF